MFKSPGSPAVGNEAAVGVHRVLLMKVALPCFCSDAALAGLQAYRDSSISRSCDVHDGI